MTESHYTEAFSTQASCRCTQASGRFSSKDTMCMDCSRLSSGVSPCTQDAPTSEQHRNMQKGQFTLQQTSEA
eukprot:10319095-Karenia_brevis.AAC.1